LFDMSNDSGLFRTRHQLEADGWRLDGNVFTRGADRHLPLYEAKMVHHFDHRYGDYEMREEGSENTALPEVPVEWLQDPTYAPLPRYWVPAANVEARMAGRWDRGWLLGWRDICRSTDERTVIAGTIPRYGSGDTFLVMFPGARPAQSACLTATLSSFCLDFVARQKVGGTHLKYHVFRQLAVLPPAVFDRPAPWAGDFALHEWLSQRTLELAYASTDLGAFASDLGYTGPPFRWDESRRLRLRCELDAAFFHLYGIPRADVDYIMDTFPIVRRNDEQKHGDYRTKNLILELYDELQRAIDTGKPFVSGLDPAPGHPSRSSPSPTGVWVG
jgi:hypothetical protein